MQSMIDGLKYYLRRRNSVQAKPGVLTNKNSRSGSGHFTTFFRTHMAGLRASLAVFRMMMLLTFSCTGFAYIGTDPAHFHGSFRAKTKQLTGGITDRSTFHVQLDTSCHHFYIVFLRTAGCTVIADCCASQAGFNTGLIVVVSLHIKNFSD